MNELVPVFVAFFFGALIWRTAKGRIRLALNLLAIFAAGLAGTLLSGEFRSSWSYLLIDLAEASAGMAAAITLSIHLQRRGSLFAARPPGHSN